MDLVYNFEGNPAYDTFLERWRNLDPDLYPGAGPGSSLSHAEPGAYSCAWMLAMGYQQEIENARLRGVNETRILRDLVTGQFPRTSGKMLVELFDNITFDGPAGKVSLDDYGNRIGGTWMFYQLQKGAEAVAVARSMITMEGEQSLIICPQRHNANWGKPLAKTLVSIAALLALACVVMVGIVIWKRRNPVIKASSPLFCTLELIGIIMLCASIPMKVSETSGPLCYTIALFLLSGINLILSAIVVKNHRAYRIFSNVYSNRIVMRDSVLLKHAGVLLVAMSAPIVYLAVARPQAVYVAIGPSSSAFICRPTNGSNVPGSVQMVMAIPTAIVLGLAWFLAYKTRGVSTNWNEARAISYIVYNLVFTVFMFTASTLLYKTMYRASSIIQDVIILYGGLVCLIVLFVPKLIFMWQQSCLGDSRTLSNSNTRTISLDDDLHHIFDGQGGGGRMRVSASDTPSGLPELRFRSLDPDIAFSKETGAAMTFEQFEGRLNEISKAAATGTCSIAMSETSTINSARSGHNHHSSKGDLEANRQRSLTFPQSPEVWGSGNGNSNGKEYRRIAPRIAPDEIVPVFGGLGLGGGGCDMSGGSLYINNNNDYNQFRLGIFSFGIKDDTQTVPVLIIDKRPWRWVFWFSAR
ncbi:hypothetical protein BGW39_007764 [Mortierella sp. 14UC]|nr:hypothetical protein BGW39_007764 [Mortierella sp. 14UC]